MKPKTILNLLIKRILKTGDVKTQTMAEGLEEILSETPDGGLKEVLSEWRGFLEDHADDDELKALYKTLECPHCGYEWRPRKVRPKACPRCKTRLDRS